MDEALITKCALSVIILIFKNLVDSKLEVRVMARKFLAQSSKNQDRLTGRNKILP